MENDRGVIRVREHRVRCDGGEAGHPVVYLSLDGDGRAVCPYCSQRFVLADGGADGGNGTPE